MPYKTNIQALRRRKEVNNRGQGTLRALAEFVGVSSQTINLYANHVLHYPSWWIVRRIESFYAREITESGLPAIYEVPDDEQEEVEQQRDRRGA